MRHYMIMSGVQMTGVIRVLEVVEPSNRLFPTSCFGAFGIYSLVVVGHRLMWHEPHDLLDRDLNCLFIQTKAVLSFLSGIIKTKVRPP